MQSKTSPRSALLPLGLILILIALPGCAGGEPEPEAAPADTATATDVPRTADPAARGLSEADFPRIQELAPDVYSYEQLRAAGQELFTTVSLFVVTDEGVLVADGQGNVEETQRMIDEIGKITDQPITHVVICSDHGDHTAGNSAFPEDAMFIAHPTSQATLEASAGNPNRPPDAPPVVIPTHQVEEEETIHLGDKEIQILFLGRAHTGGDLHVYLPEEKILFMSEVYLNRVFPAMRSAHPSEWVEAIDRALAMDVETYVPGHGFVEEPQVLREELEKYREALQYVIAESKRLYDEGLNEADALAQADWGEYGDWSLASGQAETTLRRVYMELEGELPE